MMDVLRRERDAAVGPDPIWDGEPECDVWWGAKGIDALIWADPTPDAEQSVDTSTEAAALVLVGDAR